MNESLQISEPTPNRYCGDDNAGKQRREAKRLAAAARLQPQVVCCGREKASKARNLPGMCLLKLGIESHCVWSSVFQELYGGTMCKVAVDAREAASDPTSSLDEAGGSLQWVHSSRATLQPNTSANKWASASQAKYFLTTLRFRAIRTYHVLLLRAALPYAA